LVAKCRRSRQKGSARDASSVEAGLRRQLIVSVESLEISRGHDGLLRGKPEPVLLLAIYRIAEAGAAMLVGRLLRRMRVEQAPPCVLELSGAELRYDTRLRGNERFALLLLAVEEDDGDGVAALHARLEMPETLALWSSSEAVPAPCGLRDWGGVASTAPAAEPVELLIDAVHARELGAGDDFVAACACCISARDRQDELWRMPLADADARNQWTATVRVRLA
jgi:hypothetical protein